MIERITIQNFRCFEKAEIRNLKQLNVLVGRNGSGKTALLEALFISNDNPELLLRIRGQRLGDNTVLLEKDKSISSLFESLFHNFNSLLPITINSFGAKINTSAKLTLQPSTLKYEFQPRGMASKSKAYTVRAGEGHSALRIVPEPSVDHKVSFFPASIKHNPAEASRRFSELSKRNEADTFVSALRTALPRLEDLSIEIETGIPMVFAKMQGVDERIPMQLVSDGIYRLLSILIGITNTQGGYVLIDELENGIYHKTFPQIVKLVYEFSRRYDVQIFITTHSKELLEAIAAVAENNEENYALLRFENGGVEQFSGKSFRSAVEQHIEIR